MKHSPIVSVLIITFNHEKYISDAIESILQQKCDFQYEIVIGEDCSTDSTRRIVEKYRRNHRDKIRVISSESNVGMLENSVRTILACRGKYIAICEGDDYWTDLSKLRKQVDFLEANPEYGMISSDIDLVNENGDSIQDKGIVLRQRKLRKPDINVFDLLKCNLINTLTACVKSSIIKPLSERIVSDNLWYIYDYWFWLQIGIDHKIKVSFEKTAAYRIHNQGISKQKGILQRNTSYILYDIINEIAHRTAKLSKDNQRTLAISLFRLLRNSMLGWREKWNLVGLLCKNPNLILSYFITLYDKL